MSIILNVSNSLNSLAKTFAADMQAQQLPVFQPYYIVTQTEGLNNWLKLQIAQHNGIAANCCFIKPSDLIHKVYLLLGGRYPNMLSSSNLAWLLYGILGEKEFHDRYRHVADYYATAGFEQDVKRWALATKMADLFDQYQIYRPDMIVNWNNNQHDAQMPHAWQQYLWHRAKQLAGEALPDKTVIRNYITNALQDEEAVSQLQHRMQAVYLFGLSVTTAYHLNIFNQVAEKISIRYYLQNPSPNYYWFDDKSEKQMAVLAQKGFITPEERTAGNPLLTNWGRVISDTFYLLFQNEQLLNAYEETDTIAPDTDTLLHKIQHDIFHNTNRDERQPVTVKDLQDGSITINACYTINREVEVLYNHLVHLVNTRQEKISPRDIVVLVTDIDAYAPYIKAVFSNAPYTFRYTIADESYAAGDSIINALKLVLSMNRQNFKAEEVLQLLDSGYIRERFGITNLPLIRRAVDEAYIRFGMEGSKDDDTLYVSWAHGLERIMLGICMKGEDPYLLDDDTVYPLDIAEGADAQELIRFVHFVQVLADSIRERSYERTIAQWAVYVEKVLQNLVCETEEDVEEEYNVIMAELEKLNTASELMQEKISFDIFSFSMLQTISSSTRQGSFAGGGITFCSLIPMRSIPFKIVALLGLSFDKFPRREMANAFNLMEQKRMKGDRNIKDNDKHLFLETILSAQECLYMSYVGQSAKDNTILPPSAILDELIDYIESGCPAEVKVRETLICRHPLHGFSKRYNSHNPRLFSYLIGDAGKPYNDKTGATKSVVPDFTEVSLHQLVAFFKHPIKTYYNKVLSIYYEEKTLLLSDTEVFELDSLQQWNIRQELLHSNDEERAHLKDRWIKTGGLPLRNMAELALQRIAQEVESIKALFDQITGNSPATALDIAVQVNDTLIRGTLGNLYEESKLVFVSYSKSEIKYLLEAAIQYTAARANGHEVTMHFLSATRVAVYTAQYMTPQDATERLQGLLELYKHGHEAMLLFHPQLKMEPADVASLDEKKYNGLLDKLFNNYSFPCEDRYLLQEYYNGFFNRENALEDFRKNCEQIVGPLATLFPDFFN